MSDLISREKALADLDGHEYPTDCEYETDEAWARGYNAAIAHVRSHLIYQPTVYAVPVVHGEWTLAFTEEENVWKCSVCDRYWLLNNGTPFDNEMNFCPKCGADMREKVE